MSAEKWKQLGIADPTTLTEARRVAHWAAQLLAAVGQTLGHRDLEDTQMSLDWIDRKGLMVGAPLTGVRQVRPALRVRDLSLLIVDEDGSGVLAGTPLDGRTLAWGLDWLRQQLTFTRGEATIHLRGPEYELASHAIGEGGQFWLADHGPALEELERWYSNARRLLTDWTAGRVDAGRVRLWPHHFDMASQTRLPIVPGKTNVRTVGLGMSPGDESINQPYFYVTPGPAPAVARLGALAHGSWHTDGWTGAVLRGTELVGLAADEQYATVRDFLSQAESAARALLEA